VISQVSPPATFAALREPILTTSADGRIIECSAGAVALFGPLDLLHRYIQDVLPFVTPPASQAEDHATWQGSITDAAGRTTDLDVSLTIVAERGQGTIGIYVVHDVSRYVELNRLREQLLYSVAHEVRGPLTALEWGLEVLAAEHETLPADERTRLLSSTRRTAQRVRTLMEDLLSAGSIRAGRFFVLPRRVSLSEIIEEALEAVNPLLTGRGQRLDLEMAPGPMYVLADARSIRQVLHNLLSNASKYSPENAVIQLRAEQCADNVRISVEDHGCGIPPEERVGLFERFYRARAGNEAPGIGLGLAIVKGIIDGHGGTIGLESEMGVGTTIQFTLPAAGDEHDQPSAGQGA
jgi:signal transduction histidine kinase